VRVARAAGEAPRARCEGVVEDISGPTEDGSGWTLTVRLAQPDSGDELVSVSESQLEATGLVLDERGRRVPLAGRPREPEPSDLIELRLFTELVDGIAAARVADEIERELAVALSGASIAIVAERHWSEPYPYELSISIAPRDDPVEALAWLALLGDGGWIASRDDGWRFDLWWSDAGGAEAAFLAPEVHAAEVSFLPWRSPGWRPESQRPLLDVLLRSGLEEPPEVGFEELDEETGDEEP